MAMVALKEQAAMMLEDFQARANQARRLGEVAQPEAPIHTKTVPSLGLFDHTTSPYPEGCTRLMESRST